VLLDEHSCGQRVLCVFIEDGDTGLAHNRPPIEFGGHKMYGCPGNAHTIGNRLALRVQAGKSREQRRMDIEHPVGKRFEEWSADQAHEPREAHQINLTRLKDVDDRPVVLLSASVRVRRDDDGLDSGIAGALQTRRIRSIRNDNGNRRAQTPVRDGVDDGLEIGTPSRNQDAEASRHGLPT